MSETTNTYKDLTPELKDSYSSSKDNKYKFQKLKDKMSSKTPNSICPDCKRANCNCQE